MTIEIRWCPSQTRRPMCGPYLRRGEPDARGVECLGYSDRVEARAMPLPKSRAHLKREISEKKWAEARQWAGGLQEEVQDAEQVDPGRDSCE